jgi:hypothetical protein
MSEKYYNPSLRQVPRTAKAPFCPPLATLQFCKWLEDIGRLRNRELLKPSPTRPKTKKSQI